jgi:hypothetical protein
MVLHRADGFTFSILVSGAVPSETDDLKGIADRAFAALGLPVMALVSPTPITLPTQLGLHAAVAQR